MGDPKAGRRTMLIALRSPDPMVRNHALNVIDEVAENSLEIKEAVINMVKSAGDLDRSQYDLRGARNFFLNGNWILSGMKL